MRNFDKYKDKILEKIRDNAQSIEYTIYTEYMGFNDEDYGYISDVELAEKVLNWLAEESKEPFKLTKLEYNILKLAQEQNYKYIARHKSYIEPSLYLYFDKPYRETIKWKSQYKGYSLELFEHLFQFVQWGGDKFPLSINTILNNYEIIEDIKNEASTTPN